MLLPYLMLRDALSEAAVPSFCGPAGQCVQRHATGRTAREEQRSGTERTPSASTLLPTRSALAARYSVRISCSSARSRDERSSTARSTTSSSMR